MTDNELIEKIKRGETVTTADVADLEAAKKLAALTVVADGQRKVESLEAARAAKSEARRQEMIKIANRSVTVADEVRNDEQIFERFCLLIGRRIGANKHALIMDQRLFGNLFLQEVPEMNALYNRDLPDVERQIANLLEKIETGGGNLSVICSDTIQTHLQRAPIFTRPDQQKPLETNFGALLAQILRIVAMLPDPPPEDDDFELWSFAQAEAAKAEITLPPKSKKAA